MKESGIILPSHASHNRGNSYPQDPHHHQHLSIMIGPDGGRISPAGTNGASQDSRGASIRVDPRFGLPLLDESTASSLPNFVTAGAPKKRQQAIQNMVMKLVSQYCLYWLRPVKHRTSLKTEMKGLKSRLLGATGRTAVESIGFLSTSALYIALL